MAAPVERKVSASTGAAALSGLALYALGRYVFRGDVPDAVVSWVYILVPGLLAFAAGYIAKHTPLPPAPAAVPPAIPAAQPGPATPAVTVIPPEAPAPVDDKPPPAA